MPYDSMDGIEIGCEVVAMGRPLSIPVSDKLLGRVLDSMGRPIDGKGPIPSLESRSVAGDPPDVLTRRTIKEQMFTGIRALDSMLPVGKGQRLGIFSGSGVGKSTLIGMISRNTKADINVIALIGERGREVKEFIENDLGEEGLKRSVVIVSTSNTPALSRLRGAFVATAIAEYFRDTGKDVMFLFDSVTRFANAQREIGLAVGEPPATRGYTPSVFALLPRLLERCATSDKGTITGFYTILVEGDDMDEPVSDTVRGIIDGHMVLDRTLAERGHFPAINVLRSISRLAPKIMKKEIEPIVTKMREYLSVYKDAEDLINVGAYLAGTNPQIDEAIAAISPINAFLRQKTSEKTDPAAMFKQLETLLPGPKETKAGKK
jgi:flagellum-specific ATP synthase